ncbi:MAG TPA: NUDIX hydrolase [Chroococcales cyanobacterium]
MENQLGWAKKLAAIAQNGLLYSESPFDIERYEKIRDIAAEMLSKISSEKTSVILGLFRGEVGYATPKVDVRGVVFENESILLVKEREDNLWTLPGGWADIGDSPSGAVVREIFEESGFRARALKLLAVLDKNKQGHPPSPVHIYKLFIECALTGGEAKTSIETDGAAFFGEGEIPELSLGRTTPAQIRRLFEHHRHPDWPADFD